MPASARARARGYSTSRAPADAKIMAKIARRRAEDLEHNNRLRVCKSGILNMRTRQLIEGKFKQAAQMRCAYSTICRLRTFLPSKSHSQSGTLLCTLCTCHSTITVYYSTVSAGAVTGPYYRIVFKLHRDLCPLVLFSSYSKRIEANFVRPAASTVCIFG